MKRVLITAFAVVSVIGSATAPAFADVLRNGSTGQPYAVQSNSGSAQGQANRSATGTVNKTTHDGFRPVVG